MNPEVAKKLEGYGVSIPINCPMMWCSTPVEGAELVATNSLGEFTMATPALSGDRLLIRTQQHLYSIRETQPASDAD